MIRFITRIYKRPQRQTIYWALEEVRRAEKKFGSVAKYRHHPCCYRHVKRDLNKVADDMGWRALEVKGDVVFWGGKKLPDDAPANQLGDVYIEEEKEAPLDVHGACLPTPLDIVDPTPSVGSVFGGNFGTWVANVSVRSHAAAATERLQELVSPW